MTDAAQHHDEDLQQGFRRRRRNDSLLAYALIAPAFIITLAFGLYPVILGLWQSLKASTVIEGEYTGLDNYTKATGSLIYVSILFLSFIMFSSAFNIYRRIHNMRDEHQPDFNFWRLMVPGFILGFGLILLSILGVIGGLFVESFSLAGIGVGYWIYPAILIGIASATFYRWRDGSPIYSRMVSSVTIMLSLTLIGVLAVTYSYYQLKEDVNEARQISELILNNNVGNAEPLLVNDNAILIDVGLDGEIPITAEVGQGTFEVFLDPDAYTEIDPEQLAGSGSTISIASNARIEIVAPLNRGFGLDPVNFNTTGTAVVESGAGSIGGGAPTFEAVVNIGEDVAILVPYDIYTTSTVGEEIIGREGETPTIETAIILLFAIIAAVAAIYFITQRIRKIPSDEDSRERRILYVSRIFLGGFIAVAFFFVTTAVIYYRQAANALDTLTKEQFDQAYLFATGEFPRGLNVSTFASQMMFFPQVVMIVTGAILMFTAYKMWNGARERETALGMFGNLYIASALMVGGWMLISELPATFVVGGRDALIVRDSLIRSATFSFGTIPPQLTLGLLLAYLLFYEIDWGKSFYRLVYFMPYVTPQVATAAVFAVLFSPRDYGLINQGLNGIGLESLGWLQEPQGVNQVIWELFGGNPRDIPPIFEGPTLAMVTVIIFNVWVYAGYNAVIFLAGLGAIPNELYEAAKVDGAGRWDAFRHITFPLLSPVTFFLTLLGVIGTFRAFGSVYVLQDNAIGDSLDVLTVQIFLALTDSNRGYAAALAFILFGVIVLLTVAQNRLSRDRVYYG